MDVSAKDHAWLGKWQRDAGWCSMGKPRALQRISTIPLNGYKRKRGKGTFLRHPGFKASKKKQLLAPCLGDVRFEQIATGRNSGTSSLLLLAMLKKRRKQLLALFAFSHGAVSFVGALGNKR